MYEFFQISESLSRAGISPPQRAASIKACPNKPRLTVFIDADGLPVDLAINPRPSQEIRPIERWAPDNHMAFPTIAVDPLFAVDDKDALNVFRKICKKNELDKQVELAQAASVLLDAASACWTEKLEKKLARQLLGGVLLLEKTGPLPLQDASFVELATRCGKVDGIVLGEFLRERAAEGISTSPLEWFAIFDGIIALSEDRKANTLLITMELDDWQNYASLANSPEVFDAINARLLAEGSSETDRTDAFGHSLAGYQETMPKLLMPKSGEKPLRSMFGEVPANYRYHRADAESFPVGNDVRMCILSAAKWIMDSDREGKTWAFLNQKTKFGRTTVDPTFVIIAPEHMPPTVPALGQLFAPLSVQAEHVSNECGFAAIAEDVTRSLRGAWNNDLTIPIHVSVITSYDKGRYKLLMSDTYTAEHFVNSAKLWQDGCANIPPIRFRIIENKKSRIVNPDLPLPSEVPPLLATVWLRSGEECRTTRQVAQDLPARLMLSSGPTAHDLAMSLLRQHLDDQVPILLAFGISRVKDRMVKIPKETPYRIAILPSVLGLLLLKAGRRMEYYMKDAYFLVGRLFNLADTLHEQYCLEVRGDVPPGLLGNSLMRTALENPIEAIEQLADRILVYQAWARSSQKENSKLAKWALGQFGSVSEALKERGVPDVVTPTGKAEMLLGYLAGAPKKDAAKESSQENAN